MSDVKIRCRSHVCGRSIAHTAKFQVLNCVRCDDAVGKKNKVLTLASKGRIFLDVQVIREEMTLNTAPILNAAPIPNTFKAAHMPHSAHNGVHVQPVFVSQSVQVSLCVGLAFWQ